MSLTGSGDSAAQGWVIEQTENAPGAFRWLTRLAQQSRDAILDDVTRAAAVDRHDRGPAHHRLDDHEPERLRR